MNDPAQQTTPVGGAGGGGPNWYYRHVPAREQRLRAALRRMVYEATHLSPERDDGSHDCRISAATLRAAREALAGTDP